MNNSTSNSKREKKSFKDEVYEVVKLIPKGKVVTYGEIATALGKPRWARQVGWALHQNQNLDVPCHRVVDRHGRLAPNFGFDGAREQRRRLVVEGIKFTDGVHVDLERCLWQDKSEFLNTKFETNLNCQNPKTKNF